MTRRTIFFSLILLTAVALFDRIGMIVYLRAWQHPNAMEHRSIALGLVSGQGFSFGDWGYYGPSSVQSPPYPFLLAGLFKIFGTDVPVDGSLHGANLAFFCAMLINALAGAGLVALTYILARTLGATALAGLIAAGAVAVWPSQVYAARPVQAVALITAALAASIILFYRAVRSGRLGPWLGYAIIATLATLTEPVFLPPLLISGLLVVFWPALNWPTRFRNAVALGLVMLAIIGPWSLRNYRVHGKMVPIKDTFWVNVWKGNNDHATGTDRLALTSEEKEKARTSGGKFDDSDLIDGEHQYDLLTPEEKSRIRGQNEVVRESVFKEFATTWIRQNPGKYLRLCGIRAIKTLTVDWDNPKSYNAAYITTRLLLLVLSIAGLFVAWRQKWSLFFPAIIAAAAMATYTLTVTAARFAIPFEPLQLCLAGALLALIFEKSTAAPSPQLHPETVP